MKKRYLIIGVLCTLTACGTNIDIKNYNQPTESNNHEPYTYNATPGTD